MAVLGRLLVGVSLLLASPLFLQFSAHHELGSGLSGIPLVQAANTEEFFIEPEFQQVTCGSQIKLVNKHSSFYLHSHEVKYGSGSGQQSVTGFPNPDDNNSYFVVSEAYSANQTCKRGNVIECGSLVRLRHGLTKRYLHSHSGHASPISKNQEVTAYAPSDGGDDWKVICDNEATHWLREAPVHLQHKETQMYLASSSKHVYSNPIAGQHEVLARASIDTSGGTSWIARQGIYFSSSS